MTKTSLKPYNTFGINASCDRLFSFSSVDELSERLNEIDRQTPFLILGGGSNVLFTEDFHGTILRNAIKGIVVVQEKENTVIVEAGGGMVWHEFVHWTIQNDFGGIENLSLIPGSVGAAPMQNIGAYGVEIKDVFHSLDAYEIETGKIRTFDLPSCQFGYRESVFKRVLRNQFVIVKVRFELQKSGHHRLNTSYGMINEELTKKGIENPTIKDVSDAVIAIRQSKLPDPKEIGNSGSFFKNPILPNSQIEKLKSEFPDIPVYPVDENHSKTAAGWLIEQDGWKGYREGDFGVHQRQALVLVNYGQASGKEIYDLSERIIASIKDKFGIELEREVNIY
ncbi:MAG: UDP-N-acetylmuramate dehydrogenase [Crocinitomicaceae bacterium]|nr:UDP-N-acetylmuramate dehydrogenase [Crocinitomicaceae bacterium]